MQNGLIVRKTRGHYFLSKKDNDLALGYNYLNLKSKEIYDLALDYGFNFYISGLDALAGEILHVPENYPTILVVEESGINQYLEILSEKNYLAVSEKDKDTLKNPNIMKKVDVLIMKGKDFSFSKNNIAVKEKGFIDLYYTITRMYYQVSVQELIRIYGNLKRNQTIASFRMKRAARDRGISFEIEWLLEEEKFPEIVKNFMINKIKDELSSK